jgi:hypothetical protein
MCASFLVFSFMFCRSIGVCWFSFCFVPFVGSIQSFFSTFLLCISCTYLVEIIFNYYYDFFFVASTKSCISASLACDYSCIVASPTSLLFLFGIAIASRSQFLLLAIALASQLFLLSAIYFYHHVSFFFLFHIVHVVYFFVYLVCASFFLFSFGFHCERHYA